MIIQAELRRKQSEYEGEACSVDITEWNERNIRDLVESVRILSKEKILVRLKSGIEKTEKLQS